MIADSRELRDYFKDYSLAEAEQELVAACLDSEVALRIAITVLEVGDFRSPQARDLFKVFYTLAGWLDMGTYDPETNRERMLGWAVKGTGENRDPEAWAGFLEMLWCKWAVVPEYVITLCTLIAETNRLADKRLDAEKAWRERPLDGPASTPRPGAAQGGPRMRKGGAMSGGIQV